MTSDALAQMTAESIQSVEQALRSVKDLVREVVELVQNIDGEIDDIKMNTARAREVAGIELRVEALEKNGQKITQKAKL
jgi:hypothetical protein